MNLKVTDWQHAVVLYLNKCSRFKFLIFLKDIFRCSLVLNQITYRSKTSWNVARWNNHHISPNHATTASQCYHQLENRFANLSNIIRSWVRHPEALLLIERESTVTEEILRDQSNASALPPSFLSALTAENASSGDLEHPNYNQR